MKNKLLLVLIALLIVLSLVACGKKKDDNDDTSSSALTQSTVSVLDNEDENLTSSELEELESIFQENVTPEIIVPGESSSVTSSTAVNASSTVTTSSTEETSSVPKEGWTIPV